MRITRISGGMRFLTYCLLLVLLFFLPSCEQLLDDVLKEGVNIKLEEPLFSGQYNANETSCPIVNGLHLMMSGSTLRKASLFEQISFNISDVVSLLTVLEVGGGSFEGTIINNSSESVILGIYFSDQSGLLDPKNQSELIGTMILSPGPNSILILEGLGNFQQAADEVSSNLSNFFAAKPLIEKVYAYLTVDGVSAIDVLVESLSLVIGALTQDEYMFQSEELSQYGPDDLNVQDAYITGTIMNEGVGIVKMQVYIGSISPDNHIIDLDVPQGVLSISKEERYYFVENGEARLDESIQSLANQTVDSVVFKLFVTSPKDIDITTDLMLNGTVKVKL